MAIRDTNFFRAALKFAEKSSGKCWRVWIPPFSVGEMGEFNQSSMGFDYREATHQERVEYKWRHNLEACQALQGWLTDVDEDVPTPCAIVLDSSLKSNQFMFDPVDSPEALP